MKIILEQAFKSLASKKLLSVLIVLMLTAGLFLTIGSVSYVRQNKDRVSGFYGAYPNDEYRFRISDPFFSQGTDSRVPDDLNCYVNLFHDLQNATEFEFYHYKLTHVSFLNLKVPDSCLTGYDTYNARRDITVPVFWREQYAALGEVSDAAAYSIDPSVFDKFNLSVAVGNDFSDFNTAQYDTLVVPIVCGWTWHDYYKIGDRIQGMGMLRRDIVTEYEIVGFLEPGTSILPPEADDPETIVSLDNRILVPMLDYSLIPAPTEDLSNHTDLSYYERNWYSTVLGAYMDLCEGVIISDNKSPPVDKYVQVNGFNFIDKDRVMVIGDTFRASTDAYFNLLALASALIMAGSALCLSLNLTDKLLTNFKNYAVHQISGGTLWGVKFFMIFEVLIIMLIANIASLLCAVFLGRGIFTYSEMGLIGVQVTRIDPVSLLYAVGLSVAVGLVSLAFPLIKLSTVEFDTLLRGKE